jgi:hypothetical protein
VLRNDGVVPDAITFDAKVKGRLTGRSRQVDLLLETHAPPHIVACEFKRHSKAIAITRLKPSRGS